MTLSQEEFFGALRILRANNLEYTHVSPNCIIFDWEDEAEKATQLLTGYDVEIKVERPVIVESTKKENKQVSVTFRDLFEIIKFW